MLHPVLDSGLYCIFLLDSYHAFPALGFYFLFFLYFSVLALVFVGILPKINVYVCMYVIVSLPFQSQFSRN